jgi:site-specific DNA recombinase
VKLDGYIRVSRIGGREGESFISPNVQRDRITAYAHAVGHEIVAWHTDLDQSGATMQRPGLSAALDRVRDGDTNGLIVLKLNRFARSIPEAVNTIRELEAAGGELVSVEESLDTHTHVGKFARTMMLAIAELEYDRIREGWSTARERAVDRGVHIACRTPTGYQRREDGRLEPDPVAAPAVLAAFKMRSAGRSNSEIGRMLTAAGVLGSVGSPGWSPAAIGRLLSNPAYKGEARSGEYVKPDAHAAIVPVDLWDAAQLRRGQRPARSGDGFLLAGVVRCSGCGYAIAPTRGTNRGRPSPTYRCKRRHPGGDCPEPAAVSAGVLEDYVVAEFFAAFEPGGFIADAVLVSSGVENARERVAEAERDLASFRDDPEILRILGRDSYLAGLEARTAQITTARTELSDELARATIPPELRQTTAAEVWNGSTVTERRELLSAVIDTIALSKGRSPIGERAHIFWRGTGPTDLPRAGRAASLHPITVPLTVPDGARVATGK